LKHCTFIRDKNQDLAAAGKNVGKMMRGQRSLTPKTLMAMALQTKFRGQTCKDCYTTCTLQDLSRQ